MRCSKCGYVSFDYLSECTKCATNLAPTREGLGYNAAKPAIPFFLGSLLSDSNDDTPEGADTEEAESSFSLDFGEDIDSEKDPGDLRRDAVGESDTARAESRAGDDFKPEDDFEFDPTKAQIEFKFGESAVPAPGIAAGTALKPEPEDSPDLSGSEDFSLLDLTDEELDLLIEEGDTTEASGKMEQSPNQAKPAKEESVLQREAGASLQMEEPVVLEENADATAQTGTALTDLSESDPPIELEELVAVAEIDSSSMPDTLRMEGSSELTPKFDGKPAPVPYVPEESVGEAVPVVDSKPITLKDDTFEIALSDKDLETILSELESTSDKKESGEKA